MQEVTKLAFDAAGLLQDSAESVGQELRGIQGGSLHPGARGGPHGITAPQTRSGEQVRRGVTARQTLTGSWTPRPAAGSRPPRPTAVSGSGEGSRPPQTLTGSWTPRPAVGSRPPRPTAVMGRKLTELGWGRSVCLRKKTEQAGVSVAGGGP